MRSSLLAIALISLATGALASTLTTPSYTIVIETHCPEGETVCDKVTYVGVSKKTGASITLTGREIHSLGPDGITPAHFLGYLFKSGETTYFVGEDGELRVSRGSKILVQETGVWKW